MKNETLIQIKDSKTIKELFTNIPIRYFEKLSFGLLLALVCTPILQMIINIFDNIGEAKWTGFFPYDPNMGWITSLYIMIIGFIGLILCLLRVIKYFATDEKIDKSIKEILKSKPYLVLLPLFFIWVWISTFLSNDISLALKGTDYRHEGAIFITSYAGFIYLGMQVDKSFDTFKKILYTFIVIGTFIGLFILIQFIGGKVPFFTYMGIEGAFKKEPFFFAGIFHHFNHYGYYLCMQIMALSSLILISKDKKIIVIASAMLFIESIAFAINNSFGSFLGAFIGIIIMTTLIIIKEKKFPPIYLIPFALLNAGCIVIALTGWPSMYSDFLQLFKDTSSIIEDPDSEEAQHAGTNRWKLWKAGLDASKDNILIGYGPEGLGESFSELWTDRPANEYIQYLGFYGIFGFLLYYVSNYFIVIKNMINIKKLDIVKFICLGICGGYLISSLFGNSTFYITPYFFMFLGILA